MQVVNERVEAEKKAQAERNALLERLKKEGEKMVAAEKQKREAAEQAAAKQADLDREARLKADVRVAYSTLKGEDFERLYPGLRDAELLKRAQDAKERQRRFTHANF